MNFVVTGIDRIGKNTFIDNVLKGYRQIHLDKPPKDKDPLIWSKSQYLDYFMTLAYQNNVVFNRGHWDELIYAPRYRDYSPNYVRIMEDSYRDELYNTIFILLYTTDFNIMQDDGQSHDFSRRQEEQEDFIKKFQESTMELPCAVGKTITNEVFMFDLAKAPHLLVAGATGQGKSVGLNAIITSLLYKKHPAELKIVLVDPKKVEFSVYSTIEKHFLAKVPDEEADPIITDVTKVVRTLNSLCKEMDTRYDLLKIAQARNIKEYNKKFIERQLNPENGHKFMPYIVVVIDEFGDLIMTAGKEVELPIARIAQLARAVGIHMIIATQRPTTNIITGTIKANFPSRIAFRVGAMIDSRTILDRPGAQQLIGRGDMLYLNGGEPVRVQCAFVDTPEVERINQFIAQQQGYLAAFELPEPDTDDGEAGESRDVDMQHLDPMFEDAARLIVREQSGSTSLIQRKFAIGYNRAGRLMDQLEKAGIVGAAHGSKPREVLIMDEMSLENLLSQWRS